VVPMSDVLYIVLTLLLFVALALLLLVIDR
jgi:hypothetical protein